MSDIIKPAIITVVHSVELWLLKGHCTLWVAADWLTHVYKKPLRWEYYSQFTLYNRLFCVQHDTNRLKM